MHAQIIIKLRLIIQLALGIAAIAATITNQIPDYEIDSPVVTEVTVADQTINSNSETIVKAGTTEEMVREYFKDIPIMADVARCESQFRQFNPDGSVLRGVQNSQDVGVMQINEKYHLATAQKLGINLYTLEGNMEYGRYLYKTQGTRPWEYSSKCWDKHREVALNI